MNIKLIKTEDLFGILLILLPIALISGPFFSDLIVTLICIYALINLKISKINFNTNFFKLGLLFYLCFFLNSLLFEYREQGFQSSFFYFRFLFFAIGIKILLDRNEVYLRYFFYTCIFSILIVSSFGLYEYLSYTFEYVKKYLEYKNENNLLRLKFIYSEFPNRVSGIFKDELIMGSFIYKIYPLFLILFFYFNKNLNYKNSFIFIIFTLLCIFITIISGDRAPLILLIFLIFLMFVVCSPSRKIFLQIILISSILGVLLIIFDARIKERLIDQTYRNINGAYNNSEITFVTKEHQGHFKASYIIFKKYPILGAGSKGFRNQCFNNFKSENDVICTTHPHSPYLQLLSETGIVGFSIALIFFIYLFLKIFFYENLKKNSRPVYINAIYITFFVYFWPLTTSGSIFNNYNSIIYYIPLGIMFFLNQKEKCLN